LSAVLDSSLLLVAGFVPKNEADRPGPEDGKRPRIFTVCKVRLQKEKKKSYRQF
jgi:hypothetical protein